MVVSTNVQLRHFEPQIELAVVHFALFLSVSGFLSAASNDDELLREPDGAVAVSGVSHLVSGFELKSIVDDHFPTFEQRIFTFRIVSSTYEVQTTFRTLSDLKIVWEGSVVLSSSLMAAHGFLLDIHLDHSFRVLQ